jgi:hypothetical protein
MRKQPIKHKNDSRDPDFEDLRLLWPLLGQLDVLHTQNLEIWNPQGTSLREVF